MKLFLEIRKARLEIVLQLLTLIYMGGGGKFAPQAVFLLQLKNGWR